MYSVKLIPLIGPLIGNSLAYRASVYGYSNSRIKSLKTSLLEKKFLQELIEANSFNEIISLLEKTSYKEDLAQASLENISNPIDLIEFSLSKNLSRTISFLAKIVPMEALPFLNTVFERYYVHNLKTILLAKHLNESRETAKKLLLKPLNVSEYKLNELLEAKDLLNVIDKLKNTEYYNALIKALPEYKKSNEIVLLLQELDLFYFQKIAKMVSESKQIKGDEKIISSLIESEIDSKNLMNILRGKINHLEKTFIEKILISGGTLKQEVLKTLLKEDSIEKLVKNIPNYNLSSSLEKFKEDNSLIHFELELESQRLKKGLSVLRRSILSIGTIMGFAYLKEQEIANIKKILRAKEFNLSKQETEKMLVFIGA